MTTSRRLVDYYVPEEVVYKPNSSRVVPLRNSHHDTVITTRAREGSYNVVEKDFGDHKVVYHIPIEYGDDYDVSQLEDISIVEEPTGRTSPKLVRRRIIEQYPDYDNNDIEYVEEVPVVSSRRQIYPSPRRQPETQVIERIYEPIPPPPTVEYIYEDDYGEQYNYRPDNVEEVEYVVRERAPREVVRSLHFHFDVNILFDLVCGRTTTSSTYGLCRGTGCTCSTIAKTSSSTSASTGFLFTTSFSSTSAAITPSDCL